MEDITWKEILFVIILMIVISNINNNKSKNYNKIETATKVNKAQKQNN